MHLKKCPSTHDNHAHLPIQLENNNILNPPQKAVNENSETKPPRRSERIKAKNET